MTPREITDTAKSMIYKYNWTQGELKDEKGRLCLFGALAAAYWGYDRILDEGLMAPKDINDPFCIAFDAVDRITRETYRMGLTDFNDDMLTMEDDIINVLGLASNRL